MMERLRRACVATIGLTLSALPATAATYTNARFGFSVQYPAAMLRPGHEPVDHDGVAFHQAGSRADFRVFAAYRMDDEAPDTIARDALTACAGVAPSLRIVRPDLVAISCTHDAQIAYQKTLVLKGALTTFQATYPVAERGRFDPIVKMMAGSLRPATR